MDMQNESFVHDRLSIKEEAPEILKAERARLQM